MEWEMDTPQILESAPFQKFKIIHLLMGPWDPRVMIFMGPRTLRMGPELMFLFIVNFGVGGAVRFLVVGTIGQRERPPRGQLWMEQCLTLLKYWPI